MRILSLFLIILVLVPSMAQAEPKLSFTEDEVALMLEMEEALQQYRAEYERLKNIGYGGETLRNDLGLLSDKVAKLAEMLKDLGTEEKVGDLTVIAKAIINNTSELKGLKSVDPNVPFTALFIVKGLNPELMGDFKYALTVSDASNGRAINILTSGLRWQHSKKNGTTALLMEFPEGLTQPGSYRFQFNQKDDEGTLRSVAVLGLNVTGEEEVQPTKLTGGDENPGSSGPKEQSKPNGSSLPTSPSDYCKEAPCSSPARLDGELIAYIKKEEGDDILDYLSCRDWEYLQERQSIYEKFLKVGMDINRRHEAREIAESKTQEFDADRNAQMSTEWNNALDQWHDELMSTLDQHWDAGSYCNAERPAVGVDNYYREAVGWMMAWPTRGGGYFEGKKKTANKLEPKYLNMMEAVAQRVREIVADIKTFNQEQKLVIRQYNDYMMAYSLYEERYKTNGRLSASDLAKAQKIAADIKRLVKDGNRLNANLRKLDNERNALLKMFNSYMPAYEAGDFDKVRQILDSMTQ